MNISYVKKLQLKKYGKTLDLYRLSQLAWSLTRGVIVAGISFLIIYPTILKICVSIMSEQDLYDMTVTYIAKNPTLENFKTVWGTLKYPGTLFNTLMLSLLTSVLQVASCLFIGYGFARYKFRGRGLLFGMVIITMVVPPQTLMIPLFLHFRFFDIFGIVNLFTGLKGVNLLDSFWPFILMSSTGMGLKNGLYIYIIRQFYRGVPKELEEAAYVDGAGALKTFFSIMLPCGVPVMITTFLFSFVWQWTDSFYSSLFLQNMKVLANSLGSLTFDVGKYTVWKTGTEVIFSPAMKSLFINTGSLLVIAPLVILYLFAQKYFVESIERSGIVG